MGREDIERIFLEVLRSRPREFVEVLLSTIEASDDLTLRLATIVSKRLAVTLNVATVNDLKALESSIRSEIAALGQKTMDLEATLKSEVSRLDQRISDIDLKIGVLDQRISGLEATLKSEVSRLDQRISDIDLKIGVLDQRISTETSALKTRINGLDKRLGRVEKTVKRISKTLENMTISIEEEARIVVERLLRERGLHISIGSMVLDKKYEFDIYGSLDGLVVVGEAKTRASESLIDRLVKRVEKAGKRWPERFRGRVIVVLYCLKYVGEPKRAEEKGVWLIESMRELTKIPTPQLG